MSFGRSEGESTEIPLFNNVKYEFHKTLSLNKRRELAEKLDKNGAKQIDRDEEDSGEPTHIITTRDFDRDNDGLKGPPFVVTPLWVDSAIKNGFVHEPKYYSPKPSMIFSGMVVTAPTLPVNDKIAICSGLLVLGGQYREVLTDDTTHVVAISDQGITYDRAMTRGLSVVLPHYFDDCMKMRRLVRMDSYTFPDPPLLNTFENQKHEEEDIINRTKDGKNAYEPLRDLIFPPYGSKFGHGDYHIEMDENVEPYLEGECIYVEPDVITEESKEAFTSWLEYLQKAPGATVANEYDKDRVTIVIALDRSSPMYIQASQDGKLVASKWWLTNTIKRKSKELPVTTLVDYPYPRGGIPDLEDAVVTITGYRDTARDYLRRLAIHCGMVYAPYLTKETKYLICPSQNLTKYVHAVEMNVTIVNHLWLEECYRHWKLLPVNGSKFNHFPSAKIMQSLVGNASLDPVLLERWWKDPAKKPKEVRLQQKSWIHHMSEETIRLLMREGKYVPSRKAAEAAATSLHEVYVPDMNAYQKEKRGKRSQAIPEIPETREPKKQKNNSSEESSDKPSEAPASSSSSSRRKSKSPSPALKPSVSSTSPHRVEKKSPPAKRTTRKGKEKTVDALKATSAAINFVERPKILFTAISVTKGMEAKLRRLGGSRVQSVDKATHLVVQDRVLRTSKFLCAVNLGIDIVTLQWLEDSINANQWEDPEKYIPKDEKNPAFDLKNSLNMAREMRNEEGSRRHATGKWLTGFDVYFLQNDEAKNKGMYDIVTTAGAKVVQRMNSSGTSNPLLVLSSAENKERWEGLKENGIPIYDRELIVIGSLRQQLDLERFRLV